MLTASRTVAGLSATLAVTLTACGADTSVPAGTSPSSTTVASVDVTTSPPSAPRPPPTVPAVDPYAGVPLIDGVEWTDTIDGPRLLVYPSRAGRDTTYPGSENRAWAEIVAAAPTADSRGMRDQFRCHWEWARLVAPGKPSWNLEPWRPDVGYPATVEATCNPGGPER